MNNTTFWVSRLNTKMNITIMLNPQGGIVYRYQLDAITGNKIGELPVPTYDDKYFNGWFTDKTSGVKITEDTIVDESMRVIYAHWIDPVAIDFDATTNGGTLVPHGYKYYPTVPFGNLRKRKGRQTSRISTVGGLLQAVME